MTTTPPKAEATKHVVDRDSVYVSNVIDIRELTPERELPPLKQWLVLNQVGEPILTRKNTHLVKAMLLTSRSTRAEAARECRRRAALSAKKNNVKEVFFIIEGSSYHENINHSNTPNGPKPAAIRAFR
jgi:hypothetical protein